VQPSYTKHVLDNFDYDALLETVQGTSVSVSLLKPGAYQGKLSHTTLSNIWIDSSTNNVAAQSVGMVPANRVLFGMLRNEVSPLKQAGVCWTKQQPLFFAPSSEMDFIQQGEADCLGLSIDSTFFATRIGALLEGDFQLQTGHWDRLSPSLKTIRSMERLTETIIDLGERGVLQGLPAKAIINLEEEIALILADIINSAMRKNQQRSVVTQVNLAWRIRNYMRDHADSRLCLTDVCAEFGVSKRTLQYMFAKEFDVSPMRYLRMIRLNRAHRSLLRSERNSSTVTEVVYDSGFWHLGDFTRNYKHLFGELPSETLRR
jgi:AraC family ethanolamine operon transcriptional activator